MYLVRYFCRESADSIGPRGHFAPLLLLKSATAFAQEPSEIRISAREIRLHFVTCHSRIRKVENAFSEDFLQQHYPTDGILDGTSWRYPRTNFSKWNSSKAEMNMHSVSSSTVGTTLFGAAIRARLASLQTRYRRNLKDQLCIGYSFVI